MRFLAFILEVFIPFVLMGSLGFIIYKIAKTKAFYKKWKIVNKRKKDSLHKIPFAEYGEDWGAFMDTFRFVLPKPALKHLDSITEDLNNLKTKANQEKWDEQSARRPENLGQIADIVYKHVPELIDEFCELPTSIAEKKVNFQGKTAVDLINENTLILAKSHREITNMLFDENLKHMTVQQAHFKSKFGQDEKPEESQESKNNTKYME